MSEELVPLPPQPNGPERDYFAAMVNSMMMGANTPQEKQAELYLRFISCVAMTWARMHIHHSDNPQEMLNLFVDHWKKGIWHTYNAGLQRHSMMLQTDLGKALTPVVGDTEDHRVKMHKNIEVVEQQIRAILAVPKENEGYQP